MQISVIIPAYNAEKYLDAAIESALGQQDVTHEVIVVDDGSADATPEILRRYVGKIRSIRQGNAGIGAARNRGAALAQGDWLAFLDADDEWQPHKLAVQLRGTDDDIGLVYTDRMNFGDSSRVTDRQSDTVDLAEGDIFQLLLLRNFLTVSSVIMRKREFDRLGGFSEEDDVMRGCEDWDLWLRYAGEGGLVRLCREPLTRYRWHAQSVTSNQDRMCQARVEVVTRALRLPRAMKCSRRLARQALAEAWSCSAWYAAPTEPRKAVKWYLRSAWYWPWKAETYKGIIKCCLGRI